MLSLVSRYGFLPFGLYRIAVGGVYALFFLR
jgi:undecaprenyl pyrophosphate phosphatase UppP